MLLRSQYNRRYRGRRLVDHAHGRDGEHPHPRAGLFHDAGAPLGARRAVNDDPDRDTPDAPTVAGDTDRERRSGDFARTRNQRQVRNAIRSELATDAPDDSPPGSESPDAGTAVIELRNVYLGFE